MRAKRTYRLQHLLFLLAALGLLPVVLIGVWGINNAIEQQRQELERSMLAMSRALASAVDSELQRTIGAARTLSYDAAIGAGDVRAFYEVARARARTQPDWRAVILTDGAGKALFSTGQPYGSAALRINDQASLQRAIVLREPVVGTVARGPRGAPAVPVRVPVIDAGKLAYVLTVALKPDQLRDILTRQKVPPGWVVSVQDGTGLRVARSRDHEGTVATGISPSLAALMDGGRLEGTGISRTLEGEEAVTAYTRIPRYGWSVAVGAPTAPITDVLLRSFALYAAAVAASLAICIGLAVSISRRILGAFGRLQDQAIRLSLGKPVEVADSAIGEVQQMGENLRAAAQVRAAIEQERAELVASLGDALASLREALARAEEAGKTKDNFLAVLGHELRNPLAPIVAALDLMDLKGETGWVRERQAMRRQVRHMSRLVDDLLDVSRITQGKLEMRRRPVDLGAVVRQALEAVQPVLAARAQEVALDMLDAPWVSGDETRLVQVVTNLLANAVRHGGGGAVALRLRRVDGQALMTVQDSGAGMTQDTASRIFEPFYQAAQPLARSAGGLGLGLTIVRSIVELHGGTVSAWSAGLGQGATFEVRLPAIDPVLDDAAPEQRVARARAARILVVDDNVDAAESVAALLGMLGHEVATAHDGQAALALLAQQAPDVAILDIGLPDMDGFALAAAIRARGWEGRLVALTGYGQDADKERARAAGFDVHLTKPVELEALARAVALGPGEPG